MERENIQVIEAETGRSVYIVRPVYDRYDATELSFEQLPEGRILFGRRADRYPPKPWKYYVIPKSVPDILAEPMGRVGAYLGHLWARECNLVFDKDGGIDVERSIVQSWADWMERPGPMGLHMDDVLRLDGWGRAAFAHETMTGRTRMEATIGAWNEVSIRVQVRRPAGFAFEAVGKIAADGRTSFGVLPHLRPEAPVCARHVRAAAGVIAAFLLDEDYGEEQVARFLAEQLGLDYDMLLREDAAEFAEAAQ